VTNDTGLEVAERGSGTVGIDRAAVARRLGVARQGAAPISALVAQAAEARGVSERTVWRWLASDDAQLTERHRFQLREDDIDEIVRWRGNLAAAWRQRRGQDPGLPGLRTFQMAVTCTLTPGDLATIREGVAGRRRHQIYLEWEPEARNGVWQADHRQLDVEVMFPRSQRPRRPWMTLFVEAKSRAVMGWAVAHQQSQATVLAAVASAIRVDDDRGPFGGIPNVLRVDGGLEFAAGGLTAACASLGIMLDTTFPHHPFHNGRVERVNGTVRSTLEMGLPGFTGGPRAADGALWGPSERLSLVQLVDKLYAWERWYNCERPHSSLAGRPPLAAWQEDASPIVVPEPSELRRLMLADVSRTIRHNGVLFANKHYLDPGGALNGRVGEVVEVRYLPHDLRSIEIYLRGDWLCTAVPQSVLTGAERQAVIDARSAEAQRQAKRQKAAYRRARSGVAPMTGPGEPQDTQVLVASDLAETRISGSEQMAAAASTSLLDLPPMGS
jgi:putative transposase